MSITLFLVVTAILLLAGIVKGITAMGLPTLGMGLLSLVMAPADAAAILVVPAILTNVAQFAMGGRRRASLRRFWPLGIAVVAGTFAGGLLLGGLSSHLAPLLLGFILLIYGIMGLGRLQLRTPTGAEPYLSPLMGLASGILTGTTGVTVMPVAPYLQSLDLDRDDLVQALGLAFSLASLALAVTLATDFTAGGDMHRVLTSLAALVPCFAGMEMGRRLRQVLSPAAFRTTFFLALAGLGAHTLLRALT